MFQIFDFLSSEKLFDEQNQKHIALERHKVTKYYKNQQLLAIWNSSPGPADPAYQVSWPAARTPPPTCAGGQDDGS